MLLGLRLADDNCLLNMAMNEFMKAAIRARPMPIDVFLLNCIVKSFCLPKRRCRFFPVNVSPALVRSLAWSGSFIIRHSAAAADDAAVSRQPGWHLRGLTPGASALRTTPTPLRGLAWPWPVFCRRRPCPAGPVRQPGWVLRQHPGGGPPWGARLVRVWRGGPGGGGWPGFGGPGRGGGHGRTRTRACCRHRGLRHCGLRGAMAGVVCGIHLEY